jgi:hypothetical protein
MKLQRREKILLGVAVGLVGAAALCFLVFTGDSRADQQLLDEETRLNTLIANKQKLLQNAKHEQDRLAEWRRQSLPAETTLARSLYQDWLHDAAGKAGFHDLRLTANEPGARRDQFAKIAFSLNCRANLGGLVQFMYDFYTAGYLHQIRKMNVRPSGVSGEMDVDISIEAVSIAAAEAKDKLPANTGRVLSLAKVSDYREPIAARNLFAGYVPPADARPAHGDDQAAATVVTGFTQVDGSWQVWMENHAAGKRWALQDGQEFDVGGRSCKVQTIRPEGEVVVELDRCRRVLRLRDNLRGGTEIGAGNGPSQIDNGPKGAAKRPAPARG